MVLGDKAEDAFRQSMIMSGGDLSVFWSNALVGSITTLGLGMLAWPLIARVIGMARRPAPSTPA
jgi:TctA family transporter